MNKTRVRLSREERMKFSAHCSRALGKGRRINRAGGSWGLYVCIMNDKKQTGRAGDGHAART